MHVRPVVRTRAVLALLVAVVLVTAACGASNTVRSGSSTSGMDASHPFGGDPATEGTPQRGGILRYGMDREPVSMDPTVPGYQIADYAVYDPLFRMNASGDVQPYLAESMTTADGGTTWVLTLRPGVKFQDETPLDADAVIFNVQRQQQIARSPGNVYAKWVKSMTAVDPLTVRFVLTQPVGVFVNAFALRSNDGTLGLMASPTAVKKWGADYGRHPVGAGPFSFVDWVPDSKIDVTRFADYWQKDKGMPYLDGIQFRPVPDTEAAYASISNGDLDVLICSYQTEILRGSNNKDLTTYYNPGNGGEYFYFNFTRAPFNDPRMREALLAALDPKAMSATQYSGFMDPAQTPFSADSPFYDAATAERYPTYDPAKAKQLIADYVKDGGDPNFTLSTANNPTRTQFAQFVQAQLKAVGVEVKLDLQDLGTFSSTVVQGGNFQLSTWVSGWPTPFPSLVQLLHTGGSGNYGRYSNPQVDSLLDDAVATTDKARQTADYKQVEAIAGKDLAIGWYSRAYTGMLTRKNVKGIVLDIPTGPQMWAGAWMSH
ncbi:ABC transporter substrate-binding protein [Pseudonocardia benzenivorans]|uniref:ABC transporter substrate-binding protein n=1 Tax=Pseudonocardia benzenivorans TaxID=228005 RepID=A0ABW3VQ35_9PSEU|nr:glutathione ABC transporter substrate-binding protein GsiB [Pseudonocardia sp. D17]